MTFTLISSTKADNTDELDRNISKFNVVVSDDTYEYEIEAYADHDDNTVEFDQPEGLEDFEQDELFILIAEATAA